jgi:hypothetical protein
MPPHHLKQGEKDLESQGHLCQLPNAALAASGKWHRAGARELQGGKHGIACYCSAQSQ